MGGDPAPEGRGAGPRVRGGVTDVAICGGGGEEEGGRGDWAGGGGAAPCTGRRPAALGRGGAGDRGAGGAGLAGGGRGR